MLLELLFGHLLALKFVGNNWAVADCSLSITAMSLPSVIVFFCITLFPKEKPGFNTSYTRSI